MYQLRALLVINLAAMVIVVSGCANVPPDELDPQAIWQRAERTHAETIRAVARLQQLESDYGAVIRLSRDGELRGRALERLAELDIAAGNYEEARIHLEQSLRAGLVPEDRRQVLLMLGDTLERHLKKSAAAATAYQQIINEHPATPEAELADLRLRAMSNE